MLFQKRSIGIALAISFIVVFGCRDLLAEPPNSTRYHSSKLNTLWTFQTPSEEVDPAKAFLELDFQNSFGNTAGKVRSYQRFPIVSTLSLSPTPAILLSMSNKEDIGEKEEVHSGLGWVVGGTVLSTVIGVGVAEGVVGYIKSLTDCNLR